MVNKFFYIKGGSETYYFALKRKLEAEGHQVIDFSMKDEKNFTSPYSQYFVDNVDYNGRSGIKTKLRIASNIIYSFEAKKKFEELIKRERPDLIHLHIFQHQISPSILDVIKKYNIPAVYTAHDLKMVCLNYKMMHHGKICEECAGGKYYHCALNRCVKESFSKSCINVIEGYFHKWRKSYDAIDVVVTPSAFYKKKMEQFGVDADRLCHIPNFLDRDMPNVKTSFASENSYLYFGRLSEEKGVLTLIKAVEDSDMKLKIVGTGPLKEELQEYIERNNVINIEMLGFKSGQELTDIVANAKAVILPSEWYENGPYSAIEALQVGRPIVGAEIGGIPELVRGNGVLFASGNALDLKEKLLYIEKLSFDDYETMKKKSLELFKEQYTWTSHYKKLLNVYEKAIEGKSKS